VSRTGLLLYHPPLFKVTAESGSFRSATYENPVSAALVPTKEGAEYGAGVGSRRGSGVAGGIATPPPPAVGDDNLRDEAKLKGPQSATQALVEKFKADSLTGKRAGILPIRVTFPAFGPSVYLVSELTGENQAPSAVLSYQHEKKAGGK
jgi:hypothetical protein